MGFIATDYFSTLFAAENGVMESVLDLVQPLVNDGGNSLLVAPFTLEEFRCAVFQMYPDKSPGPDGFNPAFYQRFWNEVGEDIFQAGCAWLSNNAFPSGLNFTNLVLIPKCENPTDMTELRPIALCNVVYKIIAKVLANRLKRVLPDVVSREQSAFVSGRAITDNVLVDFESLHYMKRKSRGKQVLAALKIDISKAYDRVSCPYLENMLLRLGFARQWVDWMMLCVSSVDFKVLVNDQLLGPIFPGRGLRQGDPLSPYLYVLCAEGLTALLKDAERRGQLHGCRVCKGAQSVSHLLFADDSILFFQSSIAEARRVKEILNIYEAASVRLLIIQSLVLFLATM